MGVFSANALEYVAHGLAPFPVDTRAKRPLVRNWQRAGLKATAEWAARFVDADGLGIVCGPRSGITEVDVDLVGNAALAAAIERFGETLIIIRTASGKSKLWYRHQGENRRTRVPGDLPIDILGAGLTIAPPSYRPDLNANYRFIVGGLADLDRLPPIKAGALEMPYAYAGRPASAIAKGERNLMLWRFCMMDSRQCDDIEALIDRAETFAAQMPVPLDRREVERVARSAWSYEAGRRNFLGMRRPQVTARDAEMDRLMDAPDAFLLLDLFRRFHSHRNSFAIAPSAMSAARIPPWSRERIERARAILIERGFLQEITAPNKGRARAGKYRLAPKMSDSGNNHLHPLSLGNPHAHEAL